MKIAAIILLVPAISPAEMVVSHFEPLQQMHGIETGKQSQSFSVQAQVPESTVLSFAALGRQFEILLEVNHRVAGGLTATVNTDRIRIYRGRLQDNPRSWARIVVFDGMPSGIFSDGNELFAIESPGDSSLSLDEPVVYRLADAHIAPGTFSCGTDSLSGPASNVTKVITSSAKAAVARGPGALSEITLSAIGDFEFTQLRGGDAAANAAIATRTNNIDGYFSEQVGIQIAVQQPVETHSDSGDPFTDTSNSDDLLDELSEYRLQTAFHNSAGLTHLWTGRELDGTTVGVAWRGALCDNYFSAGLTQGDSGALLDSLIAAHEIGHNFGAQHDGEPGTSCADVAGDFIMSASVSGSQQFSACSIAEMQAEAAGAACVTALPTVDVSIAPANDFSSLLLGVASELQYEVSSNGTLAAADVQAGFVIPATLAVDGVTVSAGSCSSGAGLVSCDLGALAGLSDAVVTIAVTPAAVGSGVVTANVTTSGSDERSDNNQDISNYAIQAPVDLVGSQPVAADVVLDSSTTFTMNIDNVSSVNATNVTANFVLDDGIQVASASWPIGACTITAQQVDCQANSLPGMSTTTLSVTVNAVARGRQFATLTLASAEPEATPQDNIITGSIVILAPEQQKDDSGGGSISVFLLLFGLAATVIARRRRYNGLLI